MHQLKTTLKRSRRQHNGARTQHKPRQTQTTTNCTKFAPREMGHRGKQLTTGAVLAEGRRSQSANVGDCEEIVTRCDEHGLGGRRGQVREITDDPGHTEG